MIQVNQNQINNGIIEKYCYNNDVNNCNIYGGLYQWDEAMQYLNMSGTRGICPPGWHIPTLGELQTLGSTVGNNGNALKAVGQGTGSGAGTNTSGFSVLLAGYRHDNGTFTSLGNYAPFWSSTEYDAPNAHSLNLYYHGSYIDFSSYLKDYGFSVRCRQD
jgi:uncharacterized protein (TIGR02145 family)